MRRSIGTHSVVLAVVVLVSACGADSELDLPGAAGSTTFVVEVGKGPKAVVLVHEAESTHCNWMPFAHTLAEAGLHVYVPDVRGGLTTVGGTDPSDLRLDVKVVADYARAKGATSVALAGASMGGTIALDVAGGLKASRVASLSGPSVFAPVNALAAIPKLRVPVLLLAATYDDPFPDNAKAMAKAAHAGDVKIEIVDGVSHGTFMLGDKAAKGTVGETLLAFLRTG